MGWRLSWLAVQGIGKDEIYDRVGVKPTGEIGMVLDHPITGKLLPSGWTVVVFDEPAHRFTLPGKVERLSAGCTILACSVYENMLNSSASLWENGRERWGVWHFGDKSVDNLETQGVMPAAFDEIERNYRALQAERSEGGHAPDDHMIEIPLPLANQMTSFEYDEGPDDFDFLDFKPKPWWRFGR